ncbi:MAG: acyl-CoA dehydratase activase [Pseudomonadota bacterium]
MLTSKPLHLGIDIGSVSVKTVLLDTEKNILFESYVRSMGEPVKTTVNVLSSLFTKIHSEQIISFSLTGRGSTQLAAQCGGMFINEVIAQIKAIEYFHPDVKTIIEMGGEDSKLILVEQKKPGMLAMQDFAMNTMCAAGTGSFLDQQASRLGYSIEEFGALALKSEVPPRIAGRCSVFAKTDMIHLQQAATPDYEIIAGLCFAMARNLKSNIGKGKKIEPPVAFQGGVAANPGVRRAFESILGIHPGAFIIPRHFFSMAAIGAVLISMEDKTKRMPFPGLASLNAFLNCKSTISQRLKPLSLSKPEPAYCNAARPVPPMWHTNSDATIEVYLGVDVGSISTNVVLIGSDKNLIAKAYIMTAGRPIEAVQKGLALIGAEWAEQVKVIGAATTGSGRYLTGNFIGADIVRNEITAQATAAAVIDPEVDTIFEIGGQDSKYIQLRGGVVVDFTMNKVCAAGTGSFLEEQAEKLGISIKEEFGSLALSAKDPVRLGERCTVFMESDLVHHQQQGCSREDLVAGLSYSIVENYLNRVVENRPVGDRIFYQGATAQNKGIVAAFEKLTGKRIAVPEHCDVTGAIGAAIIAMKERVWDKSRFKGFELSKAQYSIKSFECSHCPNRCEIRKMTVEKERPMYYGGRCERYEQEQLSETSTLPDLFKEREAWLLKTPFEEVTRKGDRGKIGIPRGMFFLELMPYWITFFESLGYSTIVSGETNKELIRKGVEGMVTEPCFPIKVAHGHVINLMDNGIDTIFLPHIVDMEKPSPDIPYSYLCPYAQTLTYTICSAIDFKKHGTRIIRPVLYFGRGKKRLLHGLKQMARLLGVSHHEISDAAKAAATAQARFYQRIACRGQEIVSGLKQDEKALVIVSRPYNGYDPGINLNIPQKLKRLGVQAIPMDFLPLDTMCDTADAKEHYWRFGQKIMAAGRLIAQDPRLFAVYITNFGCGPDSFISHFFQDALQGKPYLDIEIDEHSADAGAVTRLEAFLDSLKNYAPTKKADPLPESIVSKKKSKAKKPRIVFVPAMSDHAFAVAAAFKACGIDSEALPEPDTESLQLGRRLTSGKECYPCILTTGDMAKRVQQKGFDPGQSAFFMPSGTGPCRFGQYHRFHRLILDRLGYKDVPIYAPTQSEVFYKELGMMDKDFARIGWKGMVAIDLLGKELRRWRPYEKKAGEVDLVYQYALKNVTEAIEKRRPLAKALASARDAFDSLSLNSAQRRPLVGIVGEIYTRANRFANEDVIRKVESLGGEVWLPTVSEWLLYINFVAMDRSLMRPDIRSFLRTFLTDRIQKIDEHSIGIDYFGRKGYRTAKDPEILKIVYNARHYLHRAFRGEAILSVGKTIDYIEKGASGILNIIPFACMPGTIANAILKRCAEDNGRIPFLNMAYDGQSEAGGITRLEAFMYQVKQTHSNLDLIDS